MPAIQLISAASGFTQTPVTTVVTELLVPNCRAQETWRLTCFVVCIKQNFRVLSSKCLNSNNPRMISEVEQTKKDGDPQRLSHFKVALSHVTQVCNLLAFYFGIRLPKKVGHSDFISSDLDIKLFAGRIARLHANVLYLCTSQGVAPIHLRHANPLARLSTLLDPNICDLGRCERCLCLFVLLDLNLTSSSTFIFLLFTCPVQVWPIRISSGIVVVRGSWRRRGLSNFRLVF